MNQSGLYHLLDIESLSRQQLNALLELSSLIRNDPATYANRLDGRVLVNMFFEPSTRTRISFEIAAKRLGMHVVNFQSDLSSSVKGEALADTFQTLIEMQPDVIAIRHPHDGMVAELAAEAGPSIHLINAGNGCIEHPTQALLDAVTLLHHHDDLDHLIITIAGDICHSRVARSAVEIFTKMGVSQIRLAGPEELLPAQSIRDAKIFSCLDEAVDGANVIMMLRIQHERFGQVSLPDNDAFYRQWGLDAERLSKAAADCLVLHPGPVNRGVEIASEVADGTQSLIREQVNNGVFVRMAVLLTLLEV